MTTDRESIVLDDVRQQDDQVSPLYISISQAAEMLPPGRNGRPTHTATISRWITSGTVSPKGEIVRLRAVRLGGRWLTTSAWLAEYARRLTPTYHDEVSIRPKVAGTRSAQRAARELDQIGI